MFFKRLLISLFEFGLSTVMVVAVIYLTYRVSIRANPDFDMEDEIKKGNVAVGILVGSILLSVSLILQKALFSVVSLFKLFLTAPGEQSVAYWQLPLIGLGHLVMAFVLAFVTVSVTLRIFGKFTTRMQEGEELKKGNVAVGILLSFVVVVASLYVSEGVSALSKALIPQPSFSKVRILK